MITVLLILLVLALVVIAIVRYDIHPFLSLFVGALLYGLLAGMPGALILRSISEGFGNVVGNIGLVILLGVIIGVFLEKTGGALVVAQKVLSWVGQKSVLLAMMITGWFMSVPVFADSAFVIMHPINKTLSARGLVPFAATTIALTLGLTASHSLVPPTPGPIAAAGLLSADLGMVIIWGSVVSLLALVPCFFFAKYYVSRFPLIPVLRVEMEGHTAGNPPSLGKSFLPLTIPLLLIVLASVAGYPTQPLGTGFIASTLVFIGHPVIALLFGVFLSFSLPEKFDRKLLSSSGWIGDALVISAPIILITGAGGVFGKVLEKSGVPDLITGQVWGEGWGLFLPYIIAFLLKTAQGSSTVAIITTASIIAPMLPSLGLAGDMGRVLTTLAIGAGALGVSHANDSFFWVMTQMTGMSVRVGNQTHSLGTFLLGVSAITVVHVLAFFLL